MGSNVKYRPKDFNEIFGNSSIINSLETVLKRKDPPHAFLFTGPQGCGKTTFARIIADKLGCSEEDFTEINSSNNRGIDTARDIIRYGHLKPMNGKSRVYLLDEVHKTTNDFQNAILKILEEPPEHLFFILCTTEPERLLKTVVSRCSSYQVNPLNPKRMTKLLQRTSEQMKKQLPGPVCEAIVKKADGIPRDALIMLDQVIDIEDKDEQIEAVQKLKLEEELIIDLCRALFQGKKWGVISEILKGLAGSDPELVRRSVLGYFTKVLLDPKVSKDMVSVVEAFSDNFYDSGFAGVVLACYALTSK